MKAALNKISKGGLLTGVGSILNIIPVYSTNSETFGHPDTQVLKSDWAAIGGDFNIAVKKIKING